MWIQHGFHEVIQRHGQNFQDTQSLEMLEISIFPLIPAQEEGLQQVLMLS